jgi:hypothetical protein
MPAVQFNINTLAIANATIKLQQMHKYALPVATRQTLTSAAFRTKTETMPEEANVFIHRKPTFFKANSKATPAKGLDINTMSASVGFVPKPGDKSHSVEDLEQQEDGGTIGNRAMIALSEGRTGNVWQGLTRLKNRRGKLEDKIFDSKNVPGTIKRKYGSSAPASDKERFVLSAILAAKEGGVVIGNRVNSHGNKIAWIIKKGIFPFRAKRKYVDSRVFAVKKGRKVNPKATHFMRKASMESQQQMEADYIKFANIQIAKIK